MLLLHLWWRLIWQQLVCFQRISWPEKERRIFSLCQQIRSWKKKKVMRSSQGHILLIHSFLFLIYKKKNLLRPISFGKIIFSAHVLNLPDLQECSQYFLIILVVRVKWTVINLPKVFFFSSKILPGHDSRKEQKLKKTIPINFADIKLSKSKKKKKKMETLNKQGTTTALTSQTLLIEKIYCQYFIFSPVLNSFPPPEPWFLWSVELFVFRHIWSTSLWTRIVQSFLLPPPENFYY